MGTRCITKFCEGGEPVCAVYRHWDGDPKIAMADLVRFLVELEIKVPLGPMSRPALDEPRLLAARYIVYLAELFAEGWEELPMKYRAQAFNELDLTDCETRLTAM